MLKCKRCGLIVDGDIVGALDVGLRGLKQVGVVGSVFVKGS